MVKEKQHIFGKGWGNHPAWLFLLLLQPILIGIAMFIGKHWGWAGITGMVVTLSSLQILGYAFYKGKLSLIIGGIMINLIYWFGLFPQLTLLN